MNYKSKSPFTVMNLRVGALTVLLLSGCAAPKPGREPAATDVNPQIAAKMAEYAMMSANVYHDPKKIAFPLEKFGWKIEEHPNNKNGLAYDIYEKANNVVFVIRGTEDYTDWINGNFSNKQYTTMLDEVRNFEKNKDNKDKTIIAFTGHSLGGGIALYLSVMKNAPSEGSYLKNVPAYSFDPSPRVYEAEHAKQQLPLPKRMALFEEGEVLTKFRSLTQDWIKPPVNTEAHSKKYEFVCTKDDLSKCLHSSDQLALALLMAGRCTNPELQKVCDELPVCKEKSQPPGNKCTP